ncbi:hypothetical protein GOV12_07285 [Candidatus Pacearchaeota archaeon]|nr:hypothetical protein [Candidatus Pacearchaeota archaeon]
MVINLSEDGIPEIGILPLKDYSENEIPIVSKRIIDYVIEKADGLDLGRDHKKGRGQDLRMILHETGEALYFAYHEISGFSSSGEFEFVLFRDSLDKIVDLLGTGKLYERNLHRRAGIEETYRNSVSFNERMREAIESI